MQQINISDPDRKRCISCFIGRPVWQAGMVSRNDISDYSSSKAKLFNRQQCPCCGVIDLFMSIPFVVNNTDHALKLFGILTNIMQEANNITPLSGPECSGKISCAKGHIFQMGIKLLPIIKRLTYF